ncbi:hypothetical protein J2W42_006012 [Rhizobium tibeticum]|nr:hypothetical protein [Rhizobium tibeticum]
MNAFEKPAKAMKQIYFLLPKRRSWRSPAETDFWLIESRGWSTRPMSKPG